MVGSSPHTRGTQAPARKVRHGVWDHPRIRGEHIGEAWHVPLKHGIIPAYAGNTEAYYNSTVKGMGSSPHTRGTLRISARSGGRSGDHPRIRGEHVHPIRSPDVRFGIIPAYAGNTIVTSKMTSSELGSSPHTRGTPTGSWCCWPARWDHPRIRGEHARTLRCNPVGGGIIPAYAGNTNEQFSSIVGRPGSSPHSRGTPKSERPG